MCIRDSLYADGDEDIVEFEPDVFLNDRVFGDETDIGAIEFAFDFE